jgi:hypothetical protein
MEKTILLFHPLRVQVLTVSRNDRETHYNKQKHCMNEQLLNDRVVSLPDVRGPNTTKTSVPSSSSSMAA